MFLCHSKGEFGTFESTQPILRKINFIIRLWFQVTHPPSIAFFWGPFPKAQLVSSNGGGGGIVEGMMCQISL